MIRNIPDFLVEAMLMNCHLEKCLNFSKANRFCFNLTMDLLKKRTLFKIKYAHAVILAFVDMQTSTPQLANYGMPFLTTFFCKNPSIDHICIVSTDHNQTVYKNRHTIMFLYNKKTIFCIKTYQNGIVISVRHTTIPYLIPEPNLSFRKFRIS